jgi:tRNA(His) 5'-end guanylyltransferase
MGSRSDALGDRMKDYERRETDHRLMNFAPVVARMDGRGFSKWTAGLQRPYDENLSRVMVEVTRRLVAETGARIGYTQSDEITLVLLVDEIGQTMMFDGKAQKLCSVLASMTTSFFMIECMERGGDELARRAMRAPQFDARVFQVPNKGEAANAVLWRELDATKNAVSMAARAFFGHSELQGKSGPQMQEMMFQKAGTNFADYPSFFKRGTFLQARSRLEALPQDVLDRMGLDATHAEQATVVRRSIEALDMPRFSKVVNREAVIFEGAEPLTQLEAEAEA